MHRSMYYYTCSTRASSMVTKTQGGTIIPACVQFQASHITVTDY